jgi:hypothetical protein
MSEDNIIVTPIINQITVAAPGPQGATRSLYLIRYFLCPHAR